MASFHAELHLTGNRYRAVRCHYSCSQPTDAHGRVNAKVRHNLLYLTVDVPHGDELLHWAATPHKPLDGQVVFYSATQLVALETLAFTAGECVGYHEIFERGVGGDGAYVCQLTITAPAFELRAGGAPAAAPVARASLKTAADVAAKGKAAAAKVARAAAKAEAIATAAATLKGKSAADIAKDAAKAAAKVILPKGLPTGLPAGFVPEHSLTTFARTIKGAEHMLPPELIEQMYHLFNAASAASIPGKPSLVHWKAVENLMRSSYYVDPDDGKTKPLNGHWPPCNGGYQRQTVQLKEGDVYDRYQSTVFNKAPNPVTGKDDLDHVAGAVFDIKIGGNFVSPPNASGDFQSFPSRALESPEDEYPFKYRIDILQDVPTDVVGAELANVIPWFGQPGGGTQVNIMFPENHKGENWKYEEWAKMKKYGYADVKVESSPSGQFDIRPDNVAHQLRDNKKKIV